MRGERFGEALSDPGDPAFKQFDFFTNPLRLMEIAHLLPLPQ
jgi:hypothetical protein